MHTCMQTCGYMHTQACTRVYTHAHHAPHTHMHTESRAHTCRRARGHTLLSGNLPLSWLQVGIAWGGGQGAALPGEAGPRGTGPCRGHSARRNRVRIKLRPSCAQSPQALPVARQPALTFCAGSRGAPGHREQGWGQVLVGTLWGDRRVREPDLPSGAGWPLGKDALGELAGAEEEGEDLGRPKCLLHQEINPLRTASATENKHTLLRTN